MVCVQDARCAVRVLGAASVIAAAVLSVSGSLAVRRKRGETAFTLLCVCSSGSSSACSKMHLKLYSSACQGAC